MIAASVTSQALASLESFPDDFDARIGKAVRAFSVLERELSILTLYLGRLTYATKLLAKDRTARDELGKLLRQSASAQAGQLNVLAQTPLFADLRTQIEELADDIMTVFKHRGLICHGIWFPADHAVTAVSWSYDVIKSEATRADDQMVIPDTQTYAAQDFEKLTAATILAAERVAVVNHRIFQVGNNQFPALFRSDRPKE